MSTLLKLIGSIGALLTATAAAAENSSAPGDYIGDCFRIVSQVEGASELEPGNVYVASKQVNGDKDDPKLKLLEGTERWIFCGLKDNGKSYDVNASALSASGARREARGARAGPMAP